MLSLVEPDKFQSLWRKLHPHSYTGVTTEWCIYTWNIEKFSLHTSSGQWTVSSVFESPCSQRKWLLEMFVEEQFDGQGNSEDVIKVYLKKDDVYIYKQFVTVELIIQNRFGLPWEFVEKELVFDSGKTRELLLSVSKKNLMESYCGLNRRLVLPNDMMTVRCNLTLSEERAGIQCTLHGCFDISQVPTWGITGNVYRIESVNTKWKLRLTVEYGYEWGRYCEVIRVFLERENFRNVKLFVKVDTSIVDRFGNAGWEACKSQLIFFCSEMNSIPVLSIPKKYIMERFCGLYKLLLLEGNRLHLMCDMVIYEDETDATFEQKEE